MCRRIIHYDNKYSAGRTIRRRWLNPGLRKEVAKIYDSIYISNSAETVRKSNFNEKESNQKLIRPTEQTPFAKKKQPKESTFTRA